MSMTLRNRAAWLTLCGCLAFAAIATAEDRPADKILAEIKAIEMPARPTDLTDQAALQNYSMTLRATMQKKADLIGELLKADPENPELATLLPLRWQTLRTSLATIRTLKSEAETVIARSHDEKVLTEAYYYKALATIMTAAPDAKPEVLLADVDTFGRKYPKDLRVPSLIFTAATRITDQGDQEGAGLVASSSCTSSSCSILVIKV